MHRSGTAGTLTAVRLRGAEHGHTLVIIDGVKVNDPSSSGAIFNFADLLADDIERIEVLRGPQSGVYGSDAIGGVVNIVTKKGRGQATASLSAEGGFFGTGNVSAGIRGGGDGHDFSLNAAGLRTSGISIAAGNEKDGYRNQTYSAKLGLRPGENLEIRLLGRYVKGHVETDNVPRDNDDRTDSDHAMGRSLLKYSLLDGDWRHAFGAAMHRKRRTFINQWGTSKYDGRKSRLDYETNFFFETPAVADATHSVTFVAERETDSQTSGGASSDVTSHSYSGEYQVGFSDRLFLSGSVRHDDNERFDDTTTSRVTVAYVLDGSGTRFHGSYGTGIKNPTLSHLFGRWGPNPDLRPEKSKGWDLGVEQDLFERRLSMDITYFNSQPTNLIEWDQKGTADFSDDRYENLEGTSRIRGLEFSARTRPTKGLSLSAQYTYTDAKDPDGGLLPRRAEHIASLNLGYAFPDGKANVNLGIDYNGKQLNRKNNPVMLDDFTLVNLAAAYKVTERIEIFGRVDNLFDTDYEEVPGYHTTGIGFFAGVRGTLELSR